MTRTLEHLQAEGLVEHHQQDAHPADYRLTTAGAELDALLSEIGRWTREHRADHTKDDDDDDDDDDR